MKQHWLFLLLPELGPGQAAKAHRIDTVVAPPKPKNSFPLPWGQPERSLLAGGVLGKVAQTTHRHCGVSCALVGVGWRNGTAGSWRAGPDIHGQRASVVPAWHQLIKVNLQRHQTLQMVLGPPNRPNPLSGERAWLGRGREEGQEAELVVVSWDFGRLWGCTSRR